AKPPLLTLHGTHERAWIAGEGTSACMLEKCLMAKTYALALAMPNAGRDQAIQRRTIVIKKGLGHPELLSAGKQLCDAMCQTSDLRIWIVQDTFVPKLIEHLLIAAGQSPIRPATLVKLKKRSKGLRQAQHLF